MLIFVGFLFQCRFCEKNIFGFQSQALILSLITTCCCFPISAAVFAVLVASSSTIEEGIIDQINFKCRSCDLDSKICSSEEEKTMQPRRVMKNFLIIDAKLIHQTLITFRCQNFKSKFLEQDISAKLA